MEHYSFVRACIAWMASLAGLPFLSIPLLFLAYKIREGRPPEDDDVRMENDEIWKRSALAGGVLTAATFGFLFLDLVLAKWADFPAGVVHFAVFLAYVAAGAGIVMVFFAYEDFFAGLAHLTIFFALPMIVLYLLNALLGFWNPVLGWFGGFLKEVPATV